MRSFLLCALVGCGGVVDSPLGDGGADSAAEAGQDVIVGVDVSPPPNDCNSVLNELQQVTLDVTQCCLQCNVTQCTMLLPGVCCPVSVNTTNTDAIKKYQDLMAQFQLLKCAVPCPDLLCRDSPSYLCSDTGHCSQ